jgi:hypothetical protein
MDAATATASRPFGMPLRAASWRAVSWLWLPALLPLPLGMLSDCSHCVTSYWLSLPIVPGVLAPVLLQLDNAWFFVVGGAVALGLYALLVLLLRELPRGYALAVRLVFAVVVALQAIGFAYALRA